MSLQLMFIVVLRGSLRRGPHRRTPRVICALRTSHHLFFSLLVALYMRHCPFGKPPGDARDGQGEEPLGDCCPCVTAWAMTAANMMVTAGLATARNISVNTLMSSGRRWAFRSLPRFLLTHGPGRLKGAPDSLSATLYTPGSRWLPVLQPPLPIPPKACCQHYIFI